MEGRSQRGPPLFLSLLLFLLSFFLLPLPTSTALEHETIFKELREDCLVFGKQQLEQKPTHKKQSPLPPTGCRAYAKDGGLEGRLGIGGKETKELKGLLVPVGVKPPNLHVFYRFSLRGLKKGYKHTDNISPLSLMSFQRSLRALCAPQKKTTSVYIYLNSMEMEEREQIESWIVTHFMSLGLKKVMIDSSAPPGNMRSWKYLMRMMKGNVTNPNDVVLQLEDDYVIVESMLQEIIEVFMTHDFCFVHPSDYPDRYQLQKKNFMFGKYRVLPSTRRYWRTIESSTVTYAARLKTITFYESRIPNPLNDYKNSRTLWDQGAEWWSPLPGLSGHMQKCQLASYYVPWLPLLQRNFDDALHKELPFLGRNLEQSLACTPNWFQNSTMIVPKPKATTRHKLRA